MNAPMRRGACPALSDPMQTGDGLIARLNPAGGVSPATLAGLADAASAFGNGLMEVTQRGNLQFRGLTPESAPLLADAVNRRGVPATNGLTVDTGPLAGIDPDEIADPRPLAEAIRAGAERLTGRLGPKVSVVIDGGGHSGLDLIQADIRLEAARSGHWRLSLAGDAATAIVIGDLPERRAYLAAIEILTELARAGLASRARDLSPDMLEGLFRAQSLTLPPSVLPDISPTRGEIGGGKASLLPEASIGEAGDESVISPLVGEMSGRTEGSAKDHQTARDFGGIIALKDGSFAVSVALPFGSVHAVDLRVLAQQAAQLGTTEIRFSPGRALILICPTEASTLATREAARAAGMVTRPDDPRLFVAACAGAPACASGHITARAIAADIAGRAPDLLDGSLTVHVSGCAKGCAHPGAAGLTFVGGADGAGLVVGGTASGLAIKEMAADAVAAEAECLSDLIRANRREGETAAVCLTRFGGRLFAQPEAAE